MLKYYNEQTAQYDKVTNNYCLFYGFVYDIK